MQNTTTNRYFRNTYAADRLTHVECALKARTRADRAMYMALADLASDSLDYLKSQVR